MNNHISKYTREYYDNKLPFELYKYHKKSKKNDWKKRGIIFVGLFDEIYDIYIHATNCDKCKKKFKNSQDRKLDHCHLITDDFNVRGVICNSCNTKNHQIWNNNTGEQYISKVKSKTYKQGFYFRIQKYWNGKRVINKRRTTLEEAIKCRDKFMADNPQYFI